jgi:hypothetical protein
MRVSTIDELSDSLTADMTWRIREITDLRANVRTAPTKLSSIRATIPILYAHWEGHVKVCAEAYVGFVAARRMRFKELQYGFSLVPLRSDFDRLSSGKLSKMDQISLIQRTDEMEHHTFRGNFKKLIETRSNLSYDVLREILGVLGIDAAEFESEADFIDRILLERRNFIAHGATVSLDEASLADMIERTIGLMRCVQNCVENAALLGAYKRAS